jgi:hypothetical protein
MLGVTLREEYRLRVFEHRMLRKAFGMQCWEAKGTFFTYNVIVRGFIIPSLRQLLL